ncbi:YciI family protein [Agromyces endophyticus]|uniref:YciI family protein n=1 Tax=Agromyces sp. H17E-10 TaxID=2932244 RepID=UPI001FD0D6C7|nr:YciI family protein [Agromyces sp. H17E-10]UOQ90661.1 YciI family protein [Agromyces sp. H17E-10]
MTDTYMYLIHEPDWDSDAFLNGGGGVPGGEPENNFPAHKAFQEAVVKLGARLVGGAALQNARHGGHVTPGTGDRVLDDAVYSDGPYPDTTEVVSGYYLVETDDEQVARQIAALVPTGGHIEWRKVFPTS